MKELILQNPSSRQVWTLARKQGAVSMFEDGAPPQAREKLNTKRKIIKGIIRYFLLFIVVNTHYILNCENPS